MLRQGGCVSKPECQRFREAPWGCDSREVLEIAQGLPAEHLARVIERGMSLIDLQPLLDSYQGRGSLAYPPQNLLAVVLYEMQQKRFSPSQWARDAKECAPVRWLLQGHVPSRTVWFNFRKRVSEDLLVRWHQQVLALALEEGMTEAKQGALDGTVLAANASRHKLVKQKKLQERLRQLREAVERDQQNLEVKDLPPWMAKTARGRRQQQDRYRHAEERMREKQERNRQKRASKRQDPNKIVVSVSDPEAAVGYDKLDVFRPLYNVQLLVDLHSPLVLTYEVFAQNGDHGTLAPMLERCADWLGHKPETVVADAGYLSGADLAVAATAGVTLIGPWQSNDYSKEKPPRQIPKEQFVWDTAEQTYFCPQGHRLQPLGAKAHKRSGPETVMLDFFRCPAEHCQSCPLKAQCTTSSKGRLISRSEHEELIDALRERMQTPAAKALLRQRGATVERLNADLKEHRGFRRINGRGLTFAKVETGLLLLSHNLKEIVKHQQSQRNQHPQNIRPRKLSA